MRVPDSVGKHYLEVMADPQANESRRPGLMPGNSLGAKSPRKLTAIWWLLARNWWK